DDFVVISGSETIQIPAGVYDYVVLNPGCNSFGVVYVASDQCDASVGSSVTFEAGQIYHFTATLQGQNDCITITNTAKTRDDVTFNVYRDDVQIASGLTEKTYVDADLANGTYCYTATAVCANGAESDPSNEECETIETSIEENNNAFQVSPNPANAKVTVEGENIESISIYNVLGQRVANIKVEGSKSHNINTTAYESGVYMLRIVTTDGSVATQRVVIAH
ncbi:MAG: T9SS type A sorting domain-containing protein, partial [Bacteroidales bacterium]|nr:T9SS type A sorting domain-containing protein [Bacteroidales bacterium]